MLSTPRIFLLILALLAALLAPAAHAQLSFDPLTTITPAQPGKFSSARLNAAIAANQTAIAPGGSAKIAVTVNVQPGWHLQSAIPHDKLLKPLRLYIPPVPGLTFGPVQYPLSHDIPGGIISKLPLAVYDNTFTILVDVSAAADAAPGPRTINATLFTQACDDKSCEFPAETPLTLTLPVAADPQPANASLFTTAASQKFFPPRPNEDPRAPSAAAKTTVNADELQLVQSRPYRPLNASADASLPVTALPLWQIILFPIIGGLILNIMPCVLPVIPLKVLTLVQQAHGDRRLAILHAVVFSAGVITLFLALGLLLGLWPLIAGGTATYGIQFQSPIFLVGISLVILALALSMLGVWTINPPSAVYQIDQPRTGYFGSFMMGLLATLLATPCSAPFLGPALAWALVQPIAVTLITFLLVGVGMSLPYVALAAFPKAIAWVPRAGRWSELLKQGLGIFMIGVALFLTLQTRPEVWPWALAGMLVLAAVCWGWGQIPTATMENGRVWTIRSVVLAVGILLGSGVYYAATRPALSENRWEPFTVAALDQALAEGRPVVIDWTASWCINCRAVEAAVLNTEEVHKAFTNNNAVLLKADITEPHPVAQELLGKLGARAIPVLAIFSPEAPHQPVVLKDWYTREAVITAVQEAADTPAPKGPSVSDVRTPQIP